MVAMLASLTWRIHYALGDNGNLKGALLSMNPILQADGSLQPIWGNRYCAHADFFSAWVSLADGPFHGDDPIIKVGGEQNIGLLKFALPERLDNLNISKADLRLYGRQASVKSTFV